MTEEEKEVKKEEGNANTQDTGCSGGCGEGQCSSGKCEEEEEKTEGCCGGGCCGA